MDSRGHEHRVASVALSKRSNLEDSVTDNIGVNIVPRGSGDASRRAIMGGLVGMGIGVPLLAACGSEDDEGNGGGTPSTGLIGKTSEVPVGGGKIFTAEKVMISQPTEGEFKAFSTICTHQKCAITMLTGDEIECGCHHSRFAVKDGSNIGGPDKTPAGSVKDLASLKVEVRGDELFVT